MIKINRNNSVIKRYLDIIGSRSFIQQAFVEKGPVDRIDALDMDTISNAYESEHCDVPTCPSLSYL